MSHPVPLQPGKCYHVYNRGNNRENIFVEERNYRYFLKLYAQHIGPVADTFAYARAFNRAYSRTGALFQRPFGRIEVASDRHFARLITYIHQNPQKHGFVADFRDWPYSSYHVHISEKPTYLKRDEVMRWFDGSARFVAAHQTTVNPREIEALAPEDFD